MFLAPVVACMIAAVSLLIVCHYTVHQFALQLSSAPVLALSYCVLEKVSSFGTVTTLVNELKSQKREALAANIAKTFANNKGLFISLLQCSGQSFCVVMSFDIYLG